MYAPLSDKEKTSIAEQFSLGYMIRTNSCVSSLPKGYTPVVVQLKYNHNRTRKPADLFTMYSRTSENSRSCFFDNLVEANKFLYDLEKVERVERGKIKAMRVFLLELLIKELIDYVKKEEYRFIFIYSTIAHIPEIFMDYKFKIRAAEKTSKITKFLGYRSL